MARFAVIVIVGTGIGAFVTACIGDPPPFGELEPSTDAGPSDEVWAACGLTPLAKISYADLNPGFVDDGGPQDVICARSVLSFGTEACGKTSVSIDNVASCFEKQSVCCTLIHESIHIRQYERTCAVCAAAGQGSPFSDCVECLLEYCDPESEAAAYHVECQLSTACGPGGSGKDGGPPPPDADLTAESDPGLACFAEWDYCRRVLANDRALPASCHGVKPDCARIVDMADVQCGCGGPADRTYGCRLACPDGRECRYGADGNCGCR